MSTVIDRRYRILLQDAAGERGPIEAQERVADIDGVLPGDAEAGSRM